MRVLTIGLLCLALAAPAAWADDLKSCEIRGGALNKRVQGFKGENRLKRLIEADLKRALRELEEGDAEECIEALNHAEKLLAGNY